MKRCMVIVMFAFLSQALSGCGSTWSAKEVGRGMQLGSMGGNGGWLAPIVWGSGVVVEQFGEATEGSREMPDHAAPAAESDEPKNVVPESQPVD